MSDWLNAPYSMYVQYTHEIPEKAVQLLEKYGWFFDDRFCYWQPPKNPHILKRVPQWLWPQKGLGGTQREKWRRRSHENQKKLISFDVRNGGEDAT